MLPSPLVGPHHEYADRGLVFHAVAFALHDVVQPTDGKVKLVFVRAIAKIPVTDDQVVVIGWVDHDADVGFNAQFPQLLEGGEGRSGIVVVPTPAIMKTGILTRSNFSRAEIAFQ